MSGDPYYGFYGGASTPKQSNSNGEKAAQTAKQISAIQKTEQAKAEPGQTVTIHGDSVGPAGKEVLYAPNSPEYQKQHGYSTYTSYTQSGSAPILLGDYRIPDKSKDLIITATPVAQTTSQPIKTGDSGFTKIPITTKEETVKTNSGMTPQQVIALANQAAENRPGPVARTFVLEGSMDTSYQVKDIEGSKKFGFGIAQGYTTKGDPNFIDFSNKAFDLNNIYGRYNYLAAQGLIGFGGFIDLAGQASRTFFIPERGTSANPERALGLNLDEGERAYKSFVMGTVGLGVTIATNRIGSVESGTASAQALGAMAAGGILGKAIPFKLSIAETRLGLGENYKGIVLEYKKPSLISSKGFIDKGVGIVGSYFDYFERASTNIKGNIKSLPGDLVKDTVSGSNLLDTKVNQISSDVSIKYQELKRTVGSSQLEIGTPTYPVKTTSVFEGVTQLGGRDIKVVDFTEGGGRRGYSPETPFEAAIKEQTISKYLPEAVDQIKLNRAAQTMSLVVENVPSRISATEYQVKVEQLSEGQKAATKTYFESIGRGELPYNMKLEGSSFAALTLEPVFDIAREKGVRSAPGDFDIRITDQYVGTFGEKWESTLKAAGGDAYFKGDITSAKGNMMLGKEKIADIHGFEMADPFADEMGPLTGTSSFGSKIYEIEGFRKQKPGFVGDVAGDTAGFQSVRKIESSVKLQSYGEGPTIFRLKDPLDVAAIQFPGQIINIMLKPGYKFNLLDQYRVGKGMEAFEYFTKTFKEKKVGDVYSPEAIRQVNAKGGEVQITADQPILKDLGYNPIDEYFKKFPKDESIKFNIKVGKRASGFDPFNLLPKGKLKGTVNISSPGRYSLKPDEVVDKGSEVKIYGVKVDKVVNQYSVFKQSNYNKSGISTISSNIKPSNVSQASQVSSYSPRSSFLGTPKSSFTSSPGSPYSGSPPSGITSYPNSPFKGSPGSPFDSPPSGGKGYSYPGPPYSPPPYGGGGGREFPPGGFIAESKLDIRFTREKKRKVSGSKRSKLAPYASIQYVLRAEPGEFKTGTKILHPTQKSATKSFFRSFGENIPLGKGRLKMGGFK